MKTEYLHTAWTQFKDYKRPWTDQELVCTSNSSSLNCIKNLVCGTWGSKSEGSIGATVRLPLQSFSLWTLFFTLHKHFTVVTHGLFWQWLLWQYWVTMDHGPTGLVLIVCSWISWHKTTWRQSPQPVVLQPVNCMLNEIFRLLILRVFHGPAEGEEELPTKAA